ncbi:MAG TPA: carboxy terminal-processing peptidase, partial [Polyangiaceae bacterium]|nr:carboxy terminal-processing peptidase [Polyangiaceae bacterium]
MHFKKWMSPIVSLALVVALALGMLGLGQCSAATPRMRSTEDDITRLTTNILERSQLAHRPLDAKLAETFLGRYIDTLDASRSLFLQADVDELTKSGAPLAQSASATGDTRPARAIFARYLERLDQRAKYVVETLRKGSFDFTGHDVYSFDRAHAERPRDDAAARALWLTELRAEYLQQKLDGKGPDQIVDTLSRRYEKQLASMKGLRNDEVLAIYLDALAHVYDPHSDYLGHEEMESFAIAMNLSLVGIGATLESADGFCKIRDLVAGGPAARSGLVSAGDRIVGVGQPGQEPVDVVNMPLPRAVELIRGPKGSVVTLKILPVGAAEGSPPKTVSLTRDQVKLEDQEAKASIVDLPSGTASTIRLGVIDLPSFYSNTEDGGRGRSVTADVARLLGKLEAEHVKGVVLDLRRNGGGSLDEAINLTGLFIRSGPVVQTRDASGHIQVGSDRDPSVRYEGPLVLLTSRSSASASEILAGALQDYGRALVVGDSTTFGKGTVQNVLPLGRVMDQLGLPHPYDPGALKVTISKFYRPSGASTQRRGVASDIVIPSTTDFSEMGETSLPDALPWDSVPRASFHPLDEVRPYVDVLRKASVQRVAGDEGFVDRAAEIARIRLRLTT